MLAFMPTLINLTNQVGKFVPLTGRLVGRGKSLIKVTDGRWCWFPKETNLGQLSINQNSRPTNWKLGHNVWCAINTSIHTFDVFLYEIIGQNLNAPVSTRADNATSTALNGYLDALPQQQLEVPNSVDQSGRSSPIRFDLQQFCPCN